MGVKVFEISWSWIFDLAVLDCSKDYWFLRFNMGIGTGKGDEVEMLKLTIECLWLKLWFAAVHMCESIC